MKPERLAKLRTFMDEGTIDPDEVHEILDALEETQFKLIGMEHSFDQEHKEKLEAQEATRVALDEGLEACLLLTMCTDRLEAVSEGDCVEVQQARAFLKGSHE